MKPAREVIGEALISCAVEDFQRDGPGVTDSILSALKAAGYEIRPKLTEVLCDVCGKPYVECTHLYCPDEITLSPPDPTAG